MKVLLTGASGFIGRHVLLALQCKGIEVVTLGRRSMPESSNHFAIDLLETNNLMSFLNDVKATHLLHLAWEAEPGKYWTSPLNIRWAEASIRLVEAFCKTGGERVVVAGTCAEYDWDYGCCSEDITPLKPKQLYGVAKDAMRRLTVAVCDQYEIPCSFGRMFLPYGLGEAPTRLIPSLIDVLSGKREPFAIQANNYRDFMHVRDVAEGFVCLLLSPAVGAYNVSSGEPCRLSELAIRLGRMLNADPESILSISTERTDEPVILVGENRKLKSLGWRQSLSLDQGLDRALNEANTSN